MMRKVLATFAATLLAIITDFALAEPAQAATCPAYKVQAVNFWQDANYCGTRWHRYPADYWNAAGNPTPWEYCLPLLGNENEDISSINNNTGFLVTVFSTTNCTNPSGQYNRLFFGYTSHPNFATMPAPPTNVVGGLNDSISSVRFGWYGS